MIRKVILKNFMPYRSEEVMPSGSSVAVVGENGHGKSAFLEAIPYAYFGISRAPVISKLSRLKGDGSHAVEVQEDSPDGLVKIRRGCKPAGEGFCTVHVGEELVAKGKSANEWIEKHLGMDMDTYMLTAFFGLKDTRHDMLINVLPSTRLETLQSLAKVGPYKTFEIRAKDRQTLAESSMTREESRIEGAKAAMTQVDDTRTQIDTLQVESVEVEANITDLKVKRDALRVDEEKYIALVKEQERVKSERVALQRDITRLENEVENLTLTISEDSIAVDEDIVAKKKIITFLEEEGTEAELKKEVVANTLGKIGALNAELGLKKVAVDTSKKVEFSTCPLCDSELLASTVQRWEQDVIDMNNAVAACQKTLKSASADYEQIQTAHKKVESLTTSIQRKVTDLKEDGDRLNAVNRELKKLVGDKEVKDARWIDLAEKLGDTYQGLKASLETVNDDITTFVSRLGTIRGSVSTLKENIKKSEENLKLIAAVEKTVKGYRAEATACKILREAWNRYGIPLSLVHEISRDIEDRATSVYQEFDNGRIEVREVDDRGKPGIDFFLVDRKGERVYGQLSEGEKVMFFVSIRVAVAGIVSEAGVSVDYLIFDEAMGNLSQKNRDVLVRLVNKVLRKSFPQVFMVSHTEMRDIFTQTLSVVETNGEARIFVS